MCKRLPLELIGDAAHQQCYLPVSRARSCSMLFRHVLIAANKFGHSCVLMRATTQTNVRYFTILDSVPLVHAQERTVFGGFCGRVGAMRTATSSNCVRGLQRKKLTYILM